MKRLIICAALLIGASLTVPTGLIQTIEGKDKPEKGNKIAPPPKPDIQTVIVPGDATPIKCKGHVKHDKKVKKGS